MRVIAAAVLTLTLIGCSSEPVSPDLVPVASVTLEPASPVVGVGKTAPLTATTKSSDGTVLPNRTITYASANTAIAAVDDRGLVTGVAVGSTQITATSEGKSGSVTLTVSGTQIASVKITPSTGSVNTGATIALTGSAFDAADAPLPGRVFAWSSANPAIATVTTLGVVQGVGAGTVSITGTSEGKSASATITVIVPPVASVTVTPNPAKVGLGDSLQLTATLKDASGTVLTGRAITWQSSNPVAASVSNTGKVRALAPGDVTITATSEGKSGTAAVSSRLRFATISAGRDFTCGVTPVHTVYCWGRNDDGQLGDGTTTDRLSPVATKIPAGVSIDSVSAGLDHGCALSSSFKVFCWGANAFGQLGTGGISSRTTPGLIFASGLNFASVSAAARFTCGVTTNNLGFCWGLNQSGQLGSSINVGTTTPNPDTVTVLGGPFRAIEADSGHACGLLSGGGVDGTGVCWGLNGAGQLGRGGGASPPFDASPLPISGSVRYASVTGGVQFTCAIRNDGTGVTDCWGLNDFGQLGTSTVNPLVQSSPVPVAQPPTTWAQVSAGRRLACGVGAPGGQGFCWGDNTFGQLGAGSTTAVPTPPGPRPVSGNLVFAEMAAGYAHACGVTPDQFAWCWGRAEDGAHPGASALGNGGTSPSNVPVQVGGQD